MLKQVSTYNINVYRNQFKVKNSLTFFRRIHMFNAVRIVTKRTAKTMENVDETVIVPREVMVTSAHDSHMTPVPTSLLRQ